MKQQIDVKQYQRLSPRAKQWYREWMVSHGYHDGGRSVPLITIGQMFEYLDEHHDHQLGLDPLSDADLEYGWMTKRYTGQAPNNEPEWYGKFDEELCDVLWREMRDALESLAGRKERTVH